jgi:hypothetical protein
MKISAPYKTRPIRFLKIHQQDTWKIKIYSISAKTEIADIRYITCAKQQLPGWLKKSTDYSLDTYNIATLMLHEIKDSCFAIINWWTDENMLQHYVYLATNENPISFKPFSNNHIVTCVWEMAVLCFERNAWVQHILKKIDAPDVNAYLAEQLNADV